MSTTKEKPESDWEKEMLSIAKELMEAGVGLRTMDKNRMWTAGNNLETMVKTFTHKANVVHLETQLQVMKKSLSLTLKALQQFARSVKEICPMKPETELLFVQIENQIDRCRLGIKPVTDGN
jgi:hypothetical protein